MIDRCDSFALNRTVMQAPYETDEGRKTICRAGQGVKCCVFLTFDCAARSWCCEKGRLGGLESYLRQRVLKGDIVASSENCSGHSDFIPAEEPQTVKGNFGE